MRESNVAELIDGKRSRLFILTLCVLAAFLVAALMCKTAFADDHIALNAKSDVDVKPISKISKFKESDYIQITLKPNAKFAVGVNNSSIKNGAALRFQQADSAKSTYYQLRFVQTDKEHHKGYYLIINANSRKAVQPANGSTKSGAKAVLRTINSYNKAQHFSIKKTGNSYRLVNRKSGLALHATSAPAKGSTRLTFVKVKNSNTQKFTFTKANKIVEEGTYNIASAKNSKQLQINSKRTANGSKANLAKASNVASHKWYIRYVPGSSNNYRIQSVLTGKYLSVSNGKIVDAPFASNAKQIWVAGWKYGNLTFKNKRSGKMLSSSGKSSISIAKESGSASQGFRISKTIMLPEGIYYIQPKSSGTVLGVSGNTTHVGSKIRLFSKNSDASRKWVAVLNSDGTYTFRNAYSARVLAIKGSSARSGLKLCQAPLSSSKLKKWKLQLNKNGGINIVSALNGASVIGSASTKSGSSSLLTGKRNAQSALFKFGETSGSSLRAKMERRIKNVSSKTNWLLVANTNSCFVGIYKGSKGNWTPYAYFPCSPGAPSSPSKKGFYKVGQKGYAFGTSSYTCYYFTQYSGNYLFHSILYNAGTFTPQDARMGVKASHGCIRLELTNAKWINKNIPVGSTVYVY